MSPDRRGAPELVIVGTGDHARVIAEAARASGLVISGFVEPRPTSGRADTVQVDGMSVLGDLEVHRQWLRNGLGFVVAIGNNQVRESAFRACFALGLTARAITHPRATVLSGASIGPGAQVCAGTVVGLDAKIGQDVIINTGATVDHDNEVGDHASIGPGAHLAGRVIVESGAHVGLGAVVREGTRIGSGALVAAGTVVIHDVPAGARVAGVPAKTMLDRR